VEDLGDGAHIGECVCGTSLIFTLDHKEQSMPTLPGKLGTVAAAAAPVS
jgi:hypothetical protein